MTYTRTSITKTLSAVVITCAVAAFYTVPAAAQTATDLNCKQCVKSKHVKNGGIKGKDIKTDAVDGSKIADGSVDNPDIASNAVDSLKVAGESLTANDMLDEAEAALLEAQRLDRGHLAARCHLGHVYAKQGRTADARNAFRAVLELTRSLDSGDTRKQKYRDEAQKALDQLGQ